MKIINDEISNPFVIINVGNYGYESLAGIMDRIKREIEYERLSNPNPWYPFAYRIKPSDETLRDNLNSWEEQYGPLPIEIDLLFCPNKCGQDVWPSFEDTPYSKEDLVNNVELIREKSESWKVEIPSINERERDKSELWKRMEEMPAHYLVCNDNEDEGYYALVIENLKLMEFEKCPELDLTMCKTHPGGKRIPYQFQGLVCSKSSERVETTYKTAYVIGKASLIYPYAVRLVPPEDF